MCSGWKYSSKMSILSPFVFIFTENSQFQEIFSKFSKLILSCIQKFNASKNHGKKDNLQNNRTQICKALAEQAHDVELNSLGGGILQQSYH